MNDSLTAIMIHYDRALLLSETLFTIYPWFRIKTAIFGFTNEENGFHGLVILPYAVVQQT